MMHRGLGPAQNGVDAGNLLFTASQVSGGPSRRLTPVVAGGVRRVNHAVFVLPRPLRKVRQPPGLVEQLRCQQPLISDSSPYPV
jgi:hypothetical protein